MLAIGQWNVTLLVEKELKLELGVEVCRDIHNLLGKCHCPRWMRE